MRPSDCTGKVEMRIRFAAVLLATCALVLASASNAEAAGPKQLRPARTPQVFAIGASLDLPVIPAKVIRVIDGDNVEVDARPWPGTTKRVSVRLQEFDAPELDADCEAERAAARNAKEALNTFLGGPGAQVVIAGVRRGSFAGRVVAQVVAGRRDASQAMLEAGHGRVYVKKKRKGRCEGDFWYRQFLWQRY